LHRRRYRSAHGLWQNEPRSPASRGVSTVAVTPQAATVFADYVAQTEAVNAVEIRPRVGGVLRKQVTIEGERVNVGALQSMP
jgi:membrane fusion protein (multidrug efflux system)